MAERRMFSKSIIDSDPFVDMPVSAQLLYFHLGMHADDDGFVSNPKQIQRSVGCSADDIKLLAVKGFIILFESGIVVITHWKVHNYIQKDRYKPTSYQIERSKIQFNKNGVYTLDTDCIQNVYTLDTQDRLGKDKLGKDRLEGGESEPDSSLPPPPKPHKKKYGEYENVLLSDEEYQRLKTEIPNTDEMIEKLSSYIASKGAKYKSHYATIRNWHKREADVKPQQQIKTNKPDYSVSFYDLLKNSEE